MDDVDLAGRHEALCRDAAISRVVNRHRVAQLVIDDAVCCRDCYDPIPLARLKAAPDAAYCVGCMELTEREERLYGN